MKITWRRIVKAWLPFTLGLVLLTGGLVRCAGGGHVSGPSPSPYDDGGYGGDAFDGGDLDENDDENSDGGDREGGSENGEGEGADRD